ncbi:MULTISPECIES: hypothetical protein [Selenomonas]|uniref:Preprotein translocase subunit Tim44 n=1 Tax=Selenomonas ruminis TaxID=2593411 RepID=A0A5D6W1L5_9FIRM|nr:MULTISPECIES: hypothetical protein [unclassified Selenomonas]MBQ1867290.1 hypothetical protein [Selenomonas sp.]TYZ22223.1 hypothetical protein FZ040_08350 [Selenomonas sp. mPRGC5]
MKMKKMAAAVMAGLMVATAVPVVTAVTFDQASVAYAAKGGAKVGGGAKSAPKASAPKASTPSSNSKSVSGNGESYKPSKNAKELEKTAPAANSKSNTAAKNNTQSGSRWGSIMRNIGLLAGGMMLGHLLSQMLGMGGGLLGDILGLVMNVVMFLAVIMILKWLWNKFRGRKNEPNVYRSGMRDLNMRQDIKDVTPKAPAERMEIHDIRGPEAGYEAKSTADKYRNR